MPDLPTVVAAAALNSATTHLAGTVALIRGLTPNVGKGYTVISSANETNNVLRILLPMDQETVCLLEACWIVVASLSEIVLEILKELPVAPAVTSD